MDAGGEAHVSITLPLARAVSVKGTISVPGETGVGRAILHKKVHDTYVPFLDGWISNGGRFEFNNVPPGPYEIVATSQAGSGASSWSVHETVEVGASDIEVALRPQ